MNSEDHGGIGYITGIPVRNLWLLMLYASDLFRYLEHKKISVQNNPDDIADLVANILCEYVKRRIKRNLSHGYRSRAAVRDRVRGRIDLLNTERHQLLQRGKVACQFDELTVNTVRNCYVRSALEVISNLVICESLSHQCRDLAVRLRSMGVIGERPSRAEVSGERFGRHDADDQAMVSAATLAFDLALPTESAGSRYLSTPDRQVEKIRKLYEKGIAGFYDVVLPKEEWSVHPGRKIRWPGESRSPNINRILPIMITDIVVDHKITKHRMVIDTKFTKIVKPRQHGGLSLKSGHIYQIYSYLRSQEGGENPMDENASGLLLYPAVGEMIDESVVIQNHKIRFATVNLAATKEEIREQLLHVVGARNYSDHTSV